jgi:hypothetical protein
VAQRQQGHVLASRIKSNQFKPAIRQATEDVACEYWLMDIDDGHNGNESRAHTPENCVREEHSLHSSHRSIDRVALCLLRPIELVAYISIHFYPGESACLLAGSVTHTRRHSSRLEMHLQRTHKTRHRILPAGFCGCHLPQ